MGLQGVPKLKRSARCSHARMIAPLSYTSYKPRPPLRRSALRRRGVVSLGKALTDSVTPTTKLAHPFDCLRSGGEHDRQLCQFRRHGKASAGLLARRRRRRHRHHRLQPANRGRRGAMSPLNGARVDRTILACSNGTAAARKPARLVQFAAPRPSSANTARKRLVSSSAEREAAGRRLIGAGWRVHLCALTGVASMWIGATTAFGSVVRKPNRLFIVSLSLSLLTDVQRVQTPAKNARGNSRQARTRPAARSRPAKVRSPRSW